MIQSRAEIDQWEQIIDTLRGTCDSLSHVLDYHEASHLQDHMPFLNYLDNQIFCCEQCMWWCEINEMTDGDRWECRDCSPPEQD